METLINIWKKPVDKRNIEHRYLVGAHKYMNLDFIEAGQDYLCMGMFVKEHTLNPYGTIHGGLLAFLAESTGNIASDSSVDDSHYTVSINMNVNHLRSFSNGLLIATARPVKLGKTVQVWNVQISDEDKIGIAYATLTLYTQQKKQ